MAPRLPNLFRTDPRNAVRLYQLFLSRLESEERHDDIIALCRRIRRLAPEDFDARRLSAFHMIEIHTLADLGRYDTAWRQLRRAERQFFGQRIDLRRHRWRREDGPIVTMTYVPLLYFTKRYEIGRELLEKTLRRWIKSGGAYDALLHVDRFDPREPERLFDVTLRHFYDALDRDVRQWRDWDRFVDALHPKLLKIAGIRRRNLRADPDLLADLNSQLHAELKQRGSGGGFSRGEADLIESPARVRAAQRADRQRRAEWHELMQPRIAETDQTIERLFGEFLGKPDSSR